MKEQKSDKVCRYCGEHVDSPVESKYGKFCSEYHVELYACHYSLGMRIIRKLGLEHV